MLQQGGARGGRGRGEVGPGERQGLVQHVEEGGVSRSEGHGGGGGDTGEANSVTPPPHRKEEKKEETAPLPQAQSRQQVERPCAGAAPSGDTTSMSAAGKACQQLVRHVSS
jgi:hypothetical protein